MQIKIKDNARDLYITSTALHGPVNYAWADTLGKIEGQTLEVETAWLFENQYNTGPRPGVSDKGLRIMDQSVAEVIDDVRGSMQRCDWCGENNVTHDVEGWNQEPTKFAADVAKLIDEVIE